MGSWNDNEAYRRGNLLQSVTYLYLVGVSVIVLLTDQSWVDLFIVWVRVRCARYSNIKASIIIFIHKIPSVVRRRAFSAGTMIVLFFPTYRNRACDAV